MKYVLYLFTATVRTFVNVLQFLMLIRALLSWFPLDEDNKFIDFLYAVTEPVVAPVRALLDKFGLFTDMPIDMAFFISFMLLSILRIFL